MTSLKDVQRWNQPVTIRQGWCDKIPMKEHPSGVYIRFTDAEKIVNRVCRWSGQDGLWTSSCWSVASTRDRNYCSSCGGKIEVE